MSIDRTPGEPPTRPGTDPAGPAPAPADTDPTAALPAPDPTAPLPATDLTAPIPATDLTAPLPTPDPTADSPTLNLDTERTVDLSPPPDEPAPEDPTAAPAPEDPIPAAPATEDPTLTDLTMADTAPGDPTLEDAAAGDPTLEDAAAGDPAKQREPVGASAGGREPGGVSAGGIGGGRAPYVDEFPLGGAAYGAPYPPIPPLGPPPPVREGPIGRYGLRRPRQGRTFAGVCAAVARATNTDPVLWRVIVAVTALFGGVGLFVYLLGWLFIPADDDEVSPIESLLGRGRSTTSGGLTVLLALAAVALIGVAVNGGVHQVLLAVGLIGGAAVLLSRRRAASGPPPGRVPGGPEMPLGGVEAPPWTPPQPAPPEVPWGGYQEPFAPHGPFARTVEPPLVQGRVARRPKSRLGKATFFVGLLAVAGLAVAKASYANVPPDAFVAAGLATVGLGLIVGTWFGRSRGLIVLGLILSIALAGATHTHVYGGAGDAAWAPATVAEIQPEYRHGLGDATLDLSKVDFTTAEHDVAVTVRQNVGDLKIIIPPRVDAKIIVTLNVGDARILDQQFSGMGDNAHTVSDDGTDGPGGGHLNLTIDVDAGDVKVSRA